MGFYNLCAVRDSVHQDGIIRNVVLQKYGYCGWNCGDGACGTIACAVVHAVKNTAVRITNGGIKQYLR